MAYGRSKNEVQQCETLLLTLLGLQSHWKWVPYHKHYWYLIRDTIIPLVRSEGSPLRTNDLITRRSVAAVWFVPKTGQQY